jgi:hypothetical protein
LRHHQKWRFQQGYWCLRHSVDFVRDKNYMYKFAILAAFAFLPLASSAASISGTDHYAWGDRAGWVNFSPSNGSVQVTDSGLTGYVWSAVVGWINLSPSNGGVLNDGTGNLSGSAWGERTGWIDFDGVSIDSSGVFSGSATSLVGGTISFSCANCRVTTSWRPVEAIVSTPSSSSSGGPRSGTSRRNFVSGISSALSQVFDRTVAPVVVSSVSVPPPSTVPSASHVSSSTTSTSELPAPPVPVASSSPVVPVEQPSAISTTSPEKPLTSEFYQALTGFFSSMKKVFFGFFK